MNGWRTGTMNGRQSGCFLGYFTQALAGLKLFFTLSSGGGGVGTHKHAHLLPNSAAKLPSVFTITLFRTLAEARPALSLCRSVALFLLLAILRPLLPARLFFGGFRFRICLSLRMRCCNGASQG